MEMQKEETKETPKETNERIQRLWDFYNRMIEKDRDRFELFKFFVKKDYKNKHNADMDDVKLNEDIWKTYQEFVKEKSAWGTQIWVFIPYYLSKHKLDIDMNKQIWEEYKKFAKENYYSLAQIKSFVEDFKVKYNLQIDGNQLVNQLIAKEYKEFAKKHRTNLKLFEKFVKYYKDKYQIDIDIVYLHMDIKDFTKFKPGSIQKQNEDAIYNSFFNVKNGVGPEQKVIDLLKTDKGQVYQDISNVGKIITAQSDKPRGLILCSLDKAGNIVHTSSCIIFKPSALANKTDKAEREDLSSNVDKYEQEEIDKSERADLSSNVDKHEQEEIDKSERADLSSNVLVYDNRVLVYDDRWRKQQEADDNEDIRLGSDDIALLWNDNFGGKTKELLKIVESIVNGIENKKKPDKLDIQYRDEFCKFLEILKQVSKCGDYTSAPGLRQIQNVCYLVSTMFCVEMLKENAKAFYKCVPRNPEDYRKSMKIGTPLSAYRYTQNLGPADFLYPVRCDLNNGQLSKKSQEYFKEIQNSTIEHPLDSSPNEHDLNTFSIKKLFKFLDKNWQQAEGYDNIISKIIDGTLKSADHRYFSEDISFVEELEKYNFYHNNIIQRQSWFDKALSFGETNARRRRINQLAKMMNNCYTKNLTPEEKEAIKSGRRQRNIVFRDCMSISNMRKRGCCGEPEVIE